MTTKYNSTKRGFTLIELLVVISIISLLSSVVLASLSKSREKANDVKHVQVLNQVRNALELYYSDRGLYPGLPPAVGEVDRQGFCFQCNTNDITPDDWLSYNDGSGITLSKYLKSIPLETKILAIYPNDPSYYTSFYYRVSDDRKRYRVGFNKSINNYNSVPRSLWGANGGQPATSSPGSIVYYSDQAAANLVADWLDTTSYPNW